MYMCVLTCVYDIYMCMWFCIWVSLHIYVVCIYDVCACGIYIRCICIWYLCAYVCTVCVHLCMWHAYMIHMNTCVRVHVPSSTCAFHDICVEARGHTFGVASCLVAGFLWFLPLHHTAQVSWPLSFCTGPPSLPHVAAGSLGLQMHSATSSLGNMAPLDPSWGHGLVWQVLSLLSVSRSLWCILTFIRALIMYTSRCHWTKAGLK